MIEPRILPGYARRGSAPIRNIRGGQARTAGADRGILATSAARMRRGFRLDLLATKTMEQSGIPERLGRRSRARLPGRRGLDYASTPIRNRVASGRESVTVVENNADIATGIPEVDDRSSAEPGGSAGISGTMPLS